MDWNVLASDTNVGSADAALLDQLTHNKFRRVDTDRKTDPLGRNQFPKARWV